MPRLELDYQRHARPFPWAGSALLALSLLALALAAADYQNMVEKAGYWEAKGGQLAGARQMKGGQREMREMMLEIKRANEVLNQITLPWEQLFQAVEWSSGRDVALLAIEPDAERHEVKISGEAKNIAAMLDYMRRLGAQEIFRSVYLQSHQVQERSALKPVRFALVAGWRAVQ